MRHSSGLTSRHRVAVWAVLVILASAGLADAQLTRGSITGTVRDPGGLAVPGATVMVVNLDTNIARTTVTSDLGFYRIPAIEPGRYKVKVEMTGFSQVEQTVLVQTALEATVNVSLKLGGVGEEITVVGQPETVALNKSNPTIGFTATARQAVELPLSAGRNIDNLVLLSPNAFRAPGSTTISVNGNRARNNNYMIDGTDNNDLSVTLRTSPVIPEAVAEFQVQTNPYNVEFGRNSGAQVNVITRSGTNRFKGDVWDYYRSAGLNARDNLEKASGLKKPARNIEHQAGASFGGPLIKDKTFFFGLVQRDSIRTGDQLGTATRIPTSAGYAALQSVSLRAGQTQASRTAVLDRLKFLQEVYAKNPTFRTVQTQLVNGVPIETGIMNVGFPSPYLDWYGLGRIDHQLSKSDSMTLRYIYNKPSSTNLNGVSNCNFGAIFCGNQNILEHNASMSETHIFSGNLLNELRVAYVKRDLQFPENDPKSPTATIGGLFTIGGASNFPQGRTQDAWQFSDVLSLSRGQHTFKLGADIRRLKLNNTAAFDSKGTYGFSNLQDYMNNTAATFAQALQTSSFLAKQWQTFFFAQDDFRVNPDLVLNLGVRYELSTAPFGFFGATDAQSLAALVPGPVKKDTNNWAPRVGFAWSPRRSGGFLGNGKTVIRGGYGITYDVLFYNILTVNGANFPRVVTPSVTNVIDVYPSVTPLSGTAVFNPLAGFVNSPEDLQNPKQHIYSFSVGREIGRDFVTEIGYTGSTGRNGINQLQANYGVLTAAQAATVASTLNQASIPSLQLRRIYPQFGSRTLIASTAKSQYHAGYVSIQKRMSHGIQFGIAYTRSRLMSDNDESLGVGAITTGSPQIPQDFANIGAEWSLSAFDRPNRLAVNYIWEIPGFKSGILKQVLGGWQLSGVTQTQSGQPFGIVTGVDSNGNGSGGDRPNVNASGSFSWDDHHKGFTSTRYVTPLGTNSLPVVNSLGNGNALRNDQRAKGFWQTDLSLQKHFDAGRHRVTVRVDALNAFNQDNYGIPTNSLNSTSFGQNLNNWGNRSITLGIKYGF